MYKIKDKKSQDWRDAETVSAMARSLYEVLKAKHPKLSLASLAEKSGLRSKGYLSDVINGRRPLALARAPGLAKALGLTGLSLNYFVGRVELENAKSDRERNKINEKLSAILKAMDVEVRSMPASLQAHGMVFECFCAIGLFGANCRRSDLIKYFGRDRAFELDAALDQLEEMGAIKREADQIHLGSKHISFVDGSEKERVAFVRAGLEDAQIKLDRWFGQRSEAHFETVVISVQRMQYQKFLNKMRAEIEAWQGELESEQADQIIRMNVQIYPLR
jgi:uncharacterized protein (TIGR02147 family)